MHSREPGSRAYHRLPGLGGVLDAQPDSPAIVCCFQAAKQHTMAEQPTQIMGKARHFHGPPLSRRDIWQWIVPGVLGVLLLLGMGIWQASAVYTRYGPVAATARSRPWFLAAALELLGVLLLTWRRLRQAHVRLTVYPESVVWRAGGRVRALSWSQIRAVWLRPRRGGLQAILQLQDGRRLSLPPLADVPAAVLALQQARAGSLLPHLKRRLERGERVAFGTLSLSRDGLCLEQETQPWKAIRRAGIKRGHLVIEFHHPPSWQMPIQRVPDLHLLLMWIAQRGVSGKA